MPMLERESEGNRKLDAIGPPLIEDMGVGGRGDGMLVNQFSMSLVVVTVWKVRQQGPHEQVVFFS